MGSEKKLNAAMAKQNQKDTLQRQDVGEYGRDEGKTQTVVYVTYFQKYLV